MQEKTEQQPTKIIVIPEEVLRDKRLNPATKMVFARISYFDEFWESSEETAEYLGLKPYTVQEAKRTLEKYGLIITVKDTGRGKRYIAYLKISELLIKKELTDEDKEKLQKLKSICEARTNEPLDKLRENMISQKPKSDLGSDMISQKLKCDLANPEITSRKSRDIGKKEGKKEGKTYSFYNEQKPTKKSSRFKKPTIPEIQARCEEMGYSVDAEYFFNYYESKGWLVGKSPMKNWHNALAMWNSRDKAKAPVAHTKDSLKGFKIWEEVMQTPLNRTKANIEASACLIKEFGEDWLRGMLKILLTCKTDDKADFRASRISNLSDLQRNWEYLVDWGRQKRLQDISKEISKETLEKGDNVF